MSNLGTALYPLGGASGRGLGENSLKLLIMGARGRRKILESRNPTDTRNRSFLPWH